VIKKESFPDRNELVVCTITKVNPYSAFASLDEYSYTGMIHVSEASSRWIKDIREAVKEGSRVVCRVMNVDEEKGHINLSIKRVKKEEANRRMEDFRNEERAEKLLDMMAKELKVPLKKLYDELGFNLQDTFGSMYKAFEIATKNKNLLIRKEIPENYVNLMIDIASKSFVEESTEIKCELNLVHYGANGIDVIKDVLSKAEKAGAKVSYLSAPRYVMKMEGRDAKNVEKKMNNIAEKIVVDMKQSGGVGKYKMLKA
jgi:translation initiation factor 2 subunit 1